MKKEASLHKAIHKIEHPLLKIPKTLGQRAADIIAEWVGSWTFILILTIFLIIWILTSGYFMLKYINGKTDPYPFILLNLVLACITAIQAPIILMSQNRQAQKERVRAEYDYSVDKKSEKEIEILMKEVKDIKEMLKRRK